MEPDPLVARLEQLIEDLRRAAGDDFDAMVEELSTANARLEQLEIAVEHRTVLAQATGLVMARYGLTAEAGFKVLARLSQDTNRKVYDIACDLVRRHDLAAVAEPERESRLGVS